MTSLRYVQRVTQGTGIQKHSTNVVAPLCALFLNGEGGSRTCNVQGVKAQQQHRVVCTPPPPFYLSPHWRIRLFAGTLEDIMTAQTRPHVSGKVTRSLKGGSVYGSKLALVVLGWKRGN